MRELGFTPKWAIDVASKVFDFSFTFAWFRHALRSLGFDDRLEEGCQSISRAAKTGRHDRTGDSEMHGVPMAISKGRSGGDAAEAFRAFILLGAIATARQGGKGLALLDFASAIRGIGRESSRLKPWLQRVVPANVRSNQVIKAFSVQLGTKNDPPEHLVRAWQDHWAPLLESLISGSGLKVVGTGTSPDGSNADEGSSPPDKDEGGVVTLVGVPVDPIDAPEAEDESAPTVRLIELDVSRTATVLKRQRIANHDLDVQHPDVVSDAELRRTLPLLWRHAEGNVPDMQHQAIMLLMILATGRAADDVQRIRFTEFDQEVGSEAQVIALNSGTWSFLALKPDNLFKPPMQSAGQWLTVRKILQVQLPPRLAALLKSVCTSGGWRDSIIDQRQLESLLRESSGAGRRLTLSRWRLRFAAELQSAIGDIGMTMLLSGNTLSHSSAPLHYYAPRIDDVAKRYRDVIWPLLDNATDSGASVRPIDARVGAESLVVDEVVFEGFRILRESIQKCSKKRLTRRNQLSVVELHNQLVTYTLSWFQVVSGHRPTHALMMLRRWDFDLVSPGAIVEDKKTDAEHLRRYVALTDGFAKHVRFYLAHLQRAGQRLGHRGLKPAFKRALDGTGPLFFRVSQDGEPEKDALASFKLGVPEPWRSLQSNWHRTWLSTRLREVGTDALDVATQMGHLDAAQHPFSSESPWAPIEIGKRLRPFLGQLESILQLVPMTGMGVKEMDPLQDLPAIRDWNASVAAHDREIQRYTKRAHQSLRKKWRETNDAAIDHVIEIVGQVVPRLGQAIVRAGAGISGLGWSDPMPDGGELEIHTEQMHAIRRQLSMDCEDTALMAARHNQFWQLLRRARQSWSWKTPAVKRWMVTTLSEPSPFLPDQMLARLHSVAVRQALENCADMSKRQGWQIMMLLVDGIYLPDAVEILRVGAGPVCRLSAGSSDLLAGESARLLSGPGALIVASIRPDPNIDLACLEKEARDLLPDKLTTGAQNILNDLASTVAAAQRVEQSPLTRTAMSERTGSTRLPISVAADFLAARHLAPVSTSAHASAPPSPLVALSMQDKHQDSQDYRRLLNALNVQKGTEKYFPLTDVHLPAHNVARARGMVEAEVKALVAQLPRDQLPYYLGLFALQLLSDSTRELRLSSIHTYVSSIGTGLIRANHEQLLSHADSDEIADLYAGMVDGLSPRSSRRTAAQCIAMHQILVDQLGLPEVDLRFLYELGEGDTAVDANVVTSREADQVFVELAHSASQEGEAFLNVETRRFNRACAVAFVLLRRFGLRISEGTLLRHRDLLLDAQGGTLFVRPSSYSWLKSVAARRVIPINGRITEDEHALLQHWCLDEAARMGEQYDPRRPLLGRFDDSRTPLGVESIRTRLLQVLRHATGRALKVHHLRHGMINETLCAFVGRSVAGGVFPAHTRPTPALVRRLKLQAGHRSLSTTIGCYFHVPDLLRIQYPVPLNRRGMVLATGATTAAIDRQLVRIGDGGRKKNRAAYDDRWRKVLMDRLPIEQQGFAEAVAEPIPDVVRSERSFDAVMLDRWTRICRTESALLDRCRASRFTDAELGALTEAIADLSDKFAYRLVASNRGARVLPPVRLPRRQQSRNVFDKMLEASSDSAWIEAAKSALLGSGASHRNHLRLTRLDAMQIQLWCEKYLQQDGFKVEVTKNADLGDNVWVLRLKLGRTNATTGLVRAAALGWVCGRALSCRASEVLR